MSDVDVVAREGGHETSSDVMPWKLDEKPVDPVVAAMSRRYFLALYMKTVNSAHEYLEVWDVRHCAPQLGTSYHPILLGRLHLIHVQGREIPA